MAFTGDTGDRQDYAFGYPAAKKYKGDTLTYCSGITSFRYDRYEVASSSKGQRVSSTGRPR